MTRAILPAAAAKVPAVTAGFWLLKILATTLGETGGDTVSMTLGLGYLLGIWLIPQRAAAAEESR